jgi:hypothetical protein
LKLRAFLHVVDKVKSPADTEHPFHGWLPYLKLVWQPSVQLLEVFSSAAILAITEPGAGFWADVAGAWGAGDVGRAATVFATSGARLCGLTTGSARCGLAICFGAGTVMLGSWLVGPVAVCEAAVPLSNTVDRTATAEGATRLDDIPINAFSQIRK